MNDVAQINGASISTDSNRLSHRAPSPAKGGYADGFQAVADVFAEHVASGAEIGASFCVYQNGELIVDLWGGLADTVQQRPWERDTRIVMFSVTKGLMAMAMAMLGDRGAFDWDAPVADYWPDFAQGGKGPITVRQLLNHRGGLPYLDEKIPLEACLDDSQRDRVRRALEAQRPAWKAGTDQGYHAITFGLYARQLFENIANESPGTFLQRELFDPLGSDVRLGTPASLDSLHASLYSPSIGARLARMVGVTLLTPEAPEAHIARGILKKDSIGRRAFTVPTVKRGGALAYNEKPVLRAELAWASATGSADGLARSYLPFANDGAHGGRHYLRPETLEPVYGRQSWSEHDAVLMKPLGWSQGFLKEQRHLFSPNPESFGHAGMGGSLGWADPVANVALGYVMNKMDWRVRSPRILRLCHTLYECDALQKR